MPDPAELADRVSTIVDTVGSALTAQVLDASPTTVNRWAAGKTLPRSLEGTRRIENLYLVVRCLLDGGSREQMRSHHEVQAWLLGMNASLDDASPAEAFLEGEYKAVMSAARTYSSAR